jgi:hypothetical protein
MMDICCHITIQYRGEWGRGDERRRLWKRENESTKQGIRQKINKK